uniref:Uncharacterized protein n=1 Tax=Rhizophora mucronata TaxID=61149 RepID=A0A2P2N211_RHIMU
MMSKVMSLQFQRIKRWSCLRTVKVYQT